MTDNIQHSLEQQWERGWDGHENAQLKRMARLSFKEKVVWLEKAQEMMINALKIENRKEGKEKAEASDI